MQKVNEIHHLLTEHLQWVLAWWFSTMKTSFAVEDDAKVQIS